METSNITTGKPVDKFVTYTDQYSDAWAEDHERNAQCNFARDKRDRPQPFCSIIGISEGEVAEMFNVIKKSKFCLTILIFENNDVMNDWITDYGYDKVYSIIWVNNYNNYERKK